MSKSEQSLYFIAIIPGQTIKTEITTFKEEVAAEFNSKGALRSPPHITLHMPFKWRNDRTGKLLEVLNNFKFDHFPVTIDLDGFDFFEPRVVFVNVVKSPPLAHLQRELSEYLMRELNLFNANYKDKGFHPHITIGFRDLKRAVFPEVKVHYQNRKYKRTFEASSICVLRHIGAKWEEWKWI